MGCDIHFFVEVRDGDKWRSVDAWEPSKYPDEDGEGALRVPYGKAFYDDRNYRLFSMLADVRNYGNPEDAEYIKPIFPPRGIPTDVTDVVRRECERWNGDAHSASWVTLAELDAYDWTQPGGLSGFVSAVDYFTWNRWKRENGESPDSWCGGVGGGRVQIISNQEMDNIVTQARDMGDYNHALDFLKTNHCSTYTEIKWGQPYYKMARSFLSDTIPRLRRLGKPEDVRAVFWFDN